VRGIVAETIGLKYIGIDLSQRQVDANQINADKLGVYPVWHCDDSRNADKYLQDESADMVFSCPPYHDLEKYSTHPLDLSNMNYEDFIEAYSDIINKACRKLKRDRFAVFVVGDIRDKNGAYKNFISDTKRIFLDNGLCLYNEIILLEQYGIAPLRAGRIFKAKRKVTKVHQNVLVFYKGNIENIRNVCRTNFKWEDLSQKR
jgi:DNA modification methylase